MAAVTESLIYPGLVVNGIGGDAFLAGAVNRAKLLAEKVETGEEFESALRAGFDYFQGNFFSKTEIIWVARLTSELSTFKFSEGLTKPV